MAPIVGSAIFESIGYRPTTDLMTAVCLIWCVIFFTFNVGFTIFQKERKIKEKREKVEKERFMSYNEENNSPKNNDSPDVQILEAIEEENECEMIVDGKVVKLPAKKKTKKRIIS